MDLYLLQNVYLLSSKYLFYNNVVRLGELKYLEEVGHFFLGMCQILHQLPTKLNFYCADFEMLHGLIHFL